MMTKKEINDGNKIVAHFMGYEYIPFNNSENIKPGWWHTKTPKIAKNLYHAQPEKLSGNFYLGRSLNDLKYHSDWNKIMGACKKWDCLDEHPIPIGNGKSLKKIEKEYVKLCDHLDHLVGLYDILPVFEHFVKCIEWYNNVRTGK